jgi:hypothetical protein
LLFARICPTNDFFSSVMEGAMKVPLFLILSSLVLITPNVAQAQVAGSTLVGVSVEEAREVATGWSAKRQVLGAPATMT